MIRKATIVASFLLALAACGLWVGSLIRTFRWVVVFGVEPFEGITTVNRADFVEHDDVNPLFYKTFNVLQIKCYRGRLMVKQIEQFRGEGTTARWSVGSPNFLYAGRSTGPADQRQQSYWSPKMPSLVGLVRRYRTLLASLPLLASLFMAWPAIAFIRGPWRRSRRRKRGLCLKCGYNLTGNVSGVCPECGERV